MAAEPTSNTYISKIKVGNTTYDIKNTTYSIDTSAGNVITLTGSDGTSVSKTLILPKITIAASQIDSSGDITFTTEQGEILTNEAYDTVLVDVSALGSTYSAISPIVAHKQSKLAFGVLFAFETMNLNNAKFVFSGIWVQIEDGTTPYTYLGKLYNNQYATTSTTVNGKSLSDNITLSKSDIGLGNVDNTADADKSVASATKATQDANGNVITTTYATKSEIGDYVAKAGDTMTGTLNVPKINANTMSTAIAISTGTNTDSYFQARKFRGEGTATMYYHAVDFGYQNHNQIDFYEYGGVYNFWKNTTSTATTAAANLALKISLDTLTNKSYTYTWPNKTGTFALTSDFAGYAKTADLATVATSGSYDDLTDKPTIPTVNDGTLTIKVEGTAKDTFTANQSGNTEIDIKASDLGLSSVMKFLGTSTTEITDGSTVGQITLSDGTTVTPTLGNVVLYGNKEFVVTSDSKWEELGDEGSHALKSITINGTGALSGGGTLEANREIKHNAGNAANKTSGLYKFSTDAYSHVNSVTAVTKADITNLGIPAQDTTYTAGTNIDITNNVISATDTTYTAGTNVQISDGNVISATDTTYTFSASNPTLSWGATSTIGTAGDATYKVTMPAKPTYSDIGAQAAGNYISYTNATATVAGTSKTVSKTDPQTLFVPNGLIMGGTAAAAGLTTRGICGVSTPTSTGACTKDSLYINYDNDNYYKRKLVLGAGITGSAISGSTSSTSTNGAYTYCAVRGDEMVAYVTSKISGLSSSNQKVKTDSVTFGDNDIIQITAGDNITVTGDATNDKITIAADLSGYATETWVTNKGYTTNAGTVTSVAVKMNGTAKGTITSSGTIDLGTVITAHQDISGKVDANSAITGATKAKITYDSKGLVTAGADLTASDIPSLPASKITSGTFADARIESASTWNAKQSALSTAQLNACNSGITSTKVSTYDGYATTIASKADSSALGDQVTFSYDSTTGTLTISPK